MSVVLVNGDGNPAVHASQDADLLGGIGGQETGILDINDKFAATIADANTVEISSGVCITKEGRRIQIDVGDVEEIVVPTGSQGTTKYYIIGFHLYTDGSGNQLAETFIDEVASPSATITEKMFKDGETEVYVSLYRITRNGLNLEGLTLMLPEIGSLAGGGIIGNTDISGIADGTVTGAIAQINTDLSAIGWTKVTSKSITDVPNTAKEIRVAIEVNFGAIGYFDMMVSDIPNIIGCCMTYYNSPSQWGYANISVTATSIIVTSQGGSTYTLKDLYYR